MITIHVQLAALSLLTLGGCAIDTDLASTAQHTISQPVLLAETGTGQVGEVTHQFDLLVVSLHDMDNQPMANTTVTFSGPATGASAWFFDNTVETDEEGFAEIRPCANSVAGTYVMWASVDNATPMPFILRNLAAAPAAVVHVHGSHQERALGFTFAEPLTVEVRDIYGNPVSDAPVTFTAPDTGATSSMGAGGVAVTDDDGHASVVATAGSVPGTYAVVATVTDVTEATPFSFILTNMDTSPFPEVHTTGFAVTTDVLAP